jgi:SET domain-containing protein
MNRIIVALIAAAVISPAIAGSAEKPKTPDPMLKVNLEFEKRTEIRKSKIPGAGNGLYAKVRIKKGETIGELGGRMVGDDNYPVGNHYIATILECAHKETHPYKYIDAKEHGANVSRINFAPSKINGKDTNFQNAAIKRLCTRPYFIFVAERDIPAGTEILSSYGPNYDYSRFMYAVEVRDYFCGLMKMDCREKYTYEH